MKKATDREGLEEIRRLSEVEWRGLFTGERPLICVGMSTCGISAHAQETWDALAGELDRLGTEARMMRVGCLGLCYAEPLACIKLPGRPLICYGRATPEAAPGLVQDVVGRGNIVQDSVLGSIALQEAPSSVDQPHSDDAIPSIWDHPMMKPQIRIALRNCGLVDPEDIGHYLARGGYRGLEKALALSSPGVIQEVKASGLRGRGGAGFPTGVKWEFCRNAPGEEKYLICNADEGGPGAFMDRAILEGDPHSVIEGMLIAAYAIGATRGFIYCRAEYPLALKRLETALAQAREAGVLGGDILGSGFDLDISVKEGAGAFVCGEETALMASIEGQRGMPRTRPPFPANSGLWGQPTNINNVETLANLPEILVRGGSWYSAFGMGRSRGTKTLSLAGVVNRTGLIEVPMGMTLNQIIFDIGGGIVGDRACKGVLTGGPSGGCIPGTRLDVPVDYESLSQMGSIVGSGSMIVIGEDTCIVDLARFFLSFVQKESCGKCTPCRIGTRQMLAILERIAGGEAELEDLDRLERLAVAVKDASLCGLGATAPNPVLTTLRYFRQEFEDHIQDRRCPSLHCSRLTSYSIDSQRCKGCGACAESCPAGAIIGQKKSPHRIDQALCLRCGSCLSACPDRFKAISQSAGQDQPATPAQEKGAL
ncbi:MAG: NADH-quinone oxidoreductase subunit NuoF [Methanosarcinales archaeon]|nr:NADH-quinone oxidoreductase subunit NuoF [Methanosarcinales archaeon]